MVLLGDHRDAVDDEGGGPLRGVGAVRVEIRGGVHHIELIVGAQLDALVAGQQMLPVDGAAAHGRAGLVCALGTGGVEAGGGQGGKSAVGFGDVPGLLAGGTPVIRGSAVQPGGVLAQDQHAPEFFLPDPEDQQTAGGVDGQDLIALAGMEIQTGVVQPCLVDIKLIPARFQGLRMAFGPLPDRLLVQLGEAPEEGLFGGVQLPVSGILAQLVQPVLFQLKIHPLDHIPGDQGRGQPPVVQGTQGRLDIPVPEPGQGRDPVGEHRHAIDTFQQQDQGQQERDELQLFHPMLSRR